jgi:predicted nucleotide-binding protein (sugar kinase/HSP70/actin superfamily)
LDDALADNQPTVILVGRSYNAYPAEASQSVAKKLSSMGVRVIPGDCLPQQTAGPTAWHYPNIIMNAVELAKRHRTLFLLYVSNFSCTIDAFIHSMLSSELGAKPYLLLEIDAHTADAGIQTRLEAFLDIINNQRPHTAAEHRFVPASIDCNGTLTTSAGERLPLTDRRVKLHFPNFSHYHWQAIALATRWQGLNVGNAIDLDGRQIERGLQYTSGRECLPLPISIGQMLQAHGQRQPGEVVGFYMMRGGAPCAVDCYLDFFQQFIRQHELQDLFIFDPQPANNYYGLNFRSLSQVLAPVITLADLFVEMEQSLRVVGESGSLDRLRACWDRYVNSSTSFRVLNGRLETLIDAISRIPHSDASNCPKVVVTGDFFTRFHPAFMEGVHDLYARQGIILMPADLNELFLYGVYAGMVDAAGELGAPANSLRAGALACMNVFRPSGWNYVMNWVAYRQLRWYEERYRRRFRRTGLVVNERNDMDKVFQHAAQHISPAVFGEAVPTVGKAVVAGSEGYQGIIVIGPFNCLPFRISEAILKPLSMQNQMPILTYESDGYAVSPAFLRQVEVHIRQVTRSTVS